MKCFSSETHLCCHTFQLGNLTKAFSLLIKWLIKILENTFVILTWTYFLSFCWNPTPYHLLSLTIHNPCPFVCPGLSTVNQQRMRNRQRPRRCCFPPPCWLARQTQNPPGQQHLVRVWRTGPMLPSLFQDSLTVGGVSQTWLLLVSDW